MELEKLQYCTDCKLEKLSQQYQVKYKNIFIIIFSKFLLLNESIKVCFLDLKIEISQKLCFSCHKSKNFLHSLRMNYFKLFFLKIYSKINCDSVSENEFKLNEMNEFSLYNDITFFSSF